MQGWPDHKQLLYTVTVLSVGSAAVLPGLAWPNLRGRGDQSALGCSCIHPNCEPSAGERRREQMSKGRCWTEPL